MTQEEMKITKRFIETMTMLVNKNLLHQKKTWVRVAVVQKLTGWDKSMLEMMRGDNAIEYRKNDKGVYEYCLESIPENLIKKAS